MVHKRLALYDKLLPSYRLYSPTASPFEWITGSNEEPILVWGYMPGLYVISNLLPATREVNNYAQILNTSLRPYFRKRFMTDLVKNPPQFIIDAERFMPVSHRTVGFVKFPELQEYVERNYTQLIPLSYDISCPSTYVHNRYTFLISAEVKPKRVFASAVRVPEVHAPRLDSSFMDVSSDSLLEYGGATFKPENLFDNSVLEDTCRDYWLLPDGMLGDVAVEIEPTALGKLMLLNTRNGPWLDRYTKDITVELYSNGQVVYKTETTMNQYPQWTELLLPDGITADRITVSINSFEGNGGGLNEIKIYSSGSNVYGQ